MAFLTDWVRGLVMLVLLGACLELLIPMNSMKKYVRMTVGLLTVLAVTRPLFGILGHQLVIDEGIFAPQSSTRIPTVGQIMEQGALYRQRSQGLALQEVRAKLASEAKEAARSVSGVGDAHASVDLRQGETDYTVQAVAVTISAGGAKAVVPTVPPVEAVRIGTKTASAPTPAVKKELTDAESRLADEVRLRVTQRLGLDSAAKVAVTFEAEVQREGGKGHE